MVKVEYRNTRNQTNQILGDASMDFDFRHNKTHAETAERLRVNHVARVQR